MYGAAGPPHGQYEYPAPSYSFDNMAPYGKNPYMPMAGGGSRRSPNAIGICGAFWVPVVIFTVVLWSQSFSMKYNNPIAVASISSLCLAITLGFMYLAFVHYRKRQYGETSPNWYMFLFFSCLGAWSFGLAMGKYNYGTNMRPYYDVLDLNVYPSVDPQISRGQQYMDGGRFVFTPSSRLDISKSMGFKNLDVYCVAPLVSGNGSMPLYDFWAVGINCCSGHTADYACGEFSNPRAISGLRLMRDDQRSFFRLAVQQAEASYNIKSLHPIFFYLMSDPIAEMNAYQDAGFKYYIMSAFSGIAVMLVLVAAATLYFSRFH